MQHAKARSADADPCRSDGWTLDRQLDFLDALARTRSVSLAARAVGMSREGAYRLRRRAGATLFAAAWDRALAATGPAPSRAEVDESHRRAIAAACWPERARRHAHPRNAKLRDLGSD